MPKTISKIAYESSESEDSDVDDYDSYDDELGDSSQEVLIKNKINKKVIFVCFFMYVRPRRKGPVQIFLQEYYKAWAKVYNCKFSYGLNNSFIFCEQRPLSVKK